MAKPKPRIGVFTLMSDGRPWQYAEARTFAAAWDIAIELKQAPRSIAYERRHRQQLSLFGQGRTVWIAPALSIGTQIPPLPRIGPCGDPLGLWFLEYRDPSKLHGSIFRRYYADAAEAAAALDANEGGPIVIVRELHAVYKRRSIECEITGRQIKDPSTAAALLRVMPIEGGTLEDSPVERFYVICLDSKHRIRAVAPLTVGTVDATLVHVRDVYRSAILANAAAIIVAHNHPSGDPTPSPDDHRLTERIRAAGELIGIVFLDHIIIGHDDRSWSFQKGAASV